MDRTDLQRLSKDELIEFVLRLQHPDKTSRNSSKPPSTDKKEKRENSRPGGAKFGHEPHNRRLAVSSSSSSFAPSIMTEWLASN
jgi:transposase